MRFVWKQDGICREDNPLRYEALGSRVGSDAYCSPYSDAVDSQGIGSCVDEIDERDDGMALSKIVVKSGSERDGLRG